jgi:hypothetical protein
MSDRLQRLRKMMKDGYMIPSAFTCSPLKIAISRNKTIMKIMTQFLEPFFDHVVWRCQILTIILRIMVLLNHSASRVALRENLPEII